MMQIKNSEIILSLGNQFTCETRKGFKELTTPFLFPDGDGISVFLKKDKQGTITVTDIGETVRWLHMRFVLDFQPESMTREIKSICAHLDVDYRHGVLCAKADNIAEVPDCIMRVAQAMLRVSNMHKPPQVRAERIQTKVSTLFKERQIPYTPNYKAQGESGEEWTVDFCANEALIYVLPVGNDAVMQKKVEHAFTAFYDMPNRNRISLFGAEEEGIMESSLWKLMGNVSDVATFSNIHMKIPQKESILSVSPLSAL